MYKIFLLAIAFFTISINGFAQVFTSTGTAAIADGTGTATPIYGAKGCLPINVTGVGTINGVTNGLSKVCVTITHDYVSDLRIILTSPDGTKVLLSQHNGDDGVNFTNTCFMDTAVNNPIGLTDGSDAPFTGVFEPDLPLGFVNNGQNANGTWQLCVDDGYAQDAGILVSCELTFSSAIPAPPITICNNTPLARNRCQDATPICIGRPYCGFVSSAVNSVDTFAGLTAAFQARAGATATIDGNGFYKFVANATTASIIFQVLGTPGTNGLEILVMNDGCAGPITTYGYTGTIGAGTTATMNLTGLNAGTPYIMMVDGRNNASPTYLFQVVSGINVFNRSPFADTICLGSNTTLTASGGSGVYTWSPATGLNTTTGAMVTASPTATTVYTITYGTVPGLSCPVLTDSIRVRVNPLPTITVPNTNLCIGSTMTLSPTSFGTWTSSAPTVATITNAGVVTPVGPGSVTFTFTDTNTCANTTPLINITAPVTPTFAPVAPFCQGDAAPVLPTTSTNGITGTWSPATVSNTMSATYTFTPTMGLCATTATLATTVTPPTVTPVFMPLAPFCQGDTPPTLPTTSTNGITGTWSPAIVNNTTASTYTFTPTPGQCANTATLMSTITPPNITPTFTAIAPFCTGSTAPTLPTTSNNGISGTWSPATVSNTLSGTYTFTPTPGQCANTATLTTSVTAAVTPSFTTVTPFCQGSTAPVLPTTSNNGITGTWSPAMVSNTMSATYTFTPNAGQCAVTTTLNVTVLPNVSPAISCTPSTNLVTFNWSAVTGATAYNISYTVNGGAAQTATTAGLNFVVPALTIGDMVAISVTPTGTGCFAAGNGSCVAVACNPPTLVLSSAPATNNQTVCINTAITNITYTVGGSATNASATGLPSGVTGTYNAGVFTISGTPTMAGNYNFTVSTSGGCSTTPVLAGNITVTALVTPTFTPIGTICQGSTAPTLPTTSTNNITGTWNPATVSTTANGTYTFTPDAGQCATTATMTVMVTTPVTPTFTAVAPICAGSTAPVLPTTSNNGITGTWSPATVSNVVSGTYTFTPTAGQCATTATLSITVNQPVIPTFTPILPFCAGATAPILVPTSNNTITGTWNPALVSNTTSGTYTFTPAAGQCATPITIPIIVVPAPVVNLGNDTTICSPNTLTLNVTNPLASYLWQDGSQNATYTVTQPGNYSVIVSNPVGCVTTDDIDVTFSQKVIYSLGRDTSLCNAQSLGLNTGLAGQSGLTFNWQDGSNGPTYNVTTPGIYYVDVINECGPARDSVVVAQGVCRVYVPTAFSPNNDGRNDVFRPLGTELVSKIDVKIFNRFGQTVFSSNRVGQTWNGKINGKDGAIGTYVYIIKYTDSLTNKEVLLKGTLLLVR